MKGYGKFLQGLLGGALEPLEALQGDHFDHPLAKGVQQAALAHPVPP